MKSVKLKDVAIITTGKTPSKLTDIYYSGGTIPFVKPPNLIGSHEIVKTEEYITENGVNKANLIAKHSIMVSCIGSLGKVGIAGTDLVTNQQINSITFNSDLVEYKYGYYYSLTLTKKLKQIANSAVVPIVNKTNFSNLDFVPRPLEEQKQIVKILDQADALRQKRKQAIVLLDEYLKSTFLEMFGDPIANPNGFNNLKLSQFYINDKDGTKCGPFGSALKKEEYVSTGISVWAMDNIQGMDFVPDNCLYISKEKFEELKKYQVVNGDIIISRAGTVGKMAIIRNQENPSIISTNLIKLSLDVNKLLPIYFISLMNYCKGRVGRLKTGGDGSFTHMNTGILDNLTFPVPPINLQNKFAEIVQKTEILKHKMINQSNELENQFQALMQKSFSLS
ncbi:restriction endonuclease subunit S [Patescibacteria group bacterium]|nr:restriction endonuclease subunit S [Patescibacteria group bacterium]MBU4016037.1 restriction endonuclease subunit S [Patescibacteria group bacterium]MBU4099194.1 restriction endonuclease subunit S [Patescibacteria group bacterium]